ncbi:MAG TPA: Rv3654c family TadE-like protein [Actinoplanes sp.]|nr:Rv3654c family TadE-like protein [Actinoplanes sp.]
MRALRGRGVVASLLLGRGVVASRPRGGQQDRGAASLLLLAVGLVLVMGGLAGAAIGAARVGRHQARVAADLGALAGAVRVIEGEAVACARAAHFVAANGARVTSCRADGLDLVVRAEVTVTPLPGLPRTAAAIARAGPVVAS